MTTWLSFTISILQYIISTFTYRLFYYIYISIFLYKGKANEIHQVYSEGWTGVFDFHSPSLYSLNPFPYFHSHPPYFQTIIVFKKKSENIPIFTPSPPLDSYFPPPWFPASCPSFPCSLSPVHSLNSIYIVARQEQHW